MDAGDAVDDALKRRATALDRALSEIAAGDELSANFAKIRLFGSNHFRRWEELDHLSYVNSATSSSIEAPFRFDTFNPDRPKCAVFIGDSHAEFGCRLPVDEPAGCDYSTFNYWLGPVTMMGVLTNPRYFESVLGAVSRSNELHGSAGKRSVIFSFGEIDARHVVYQFITREKFGSVDDYVSFLRPLLNSFFDKLTSRFPDNTFFMLQPIPTSNVKPYRSPVSVAEMQSYYDEFEHPSLGAPELRRSFWRRIDEMATETCDSQSVRYLRLPSFYFDDGYLNPKHTGDDTHISSREALQHQESMHERVLFAD
jgi:hypothetical protein